MASVDKNIERLIVRRLDGALTEDEALQLDRALIRNPEARAMLEDYQRVDTLASAALADVLGGEVSFDVSTLTPRVPAAAAAPPPVIYRRGTWLIPGAIAAALLAMVLPTPSWHQQDGSQAAGRTSHPTRFSRPVGTIDPRGTAPRSIGSPNLQRNVSHLPRTRGKTVRDVIGVMGDDGGIYWIEVDRSRTVREMPKGRANIPLGGL